MARLDVVLVDGAEDRRTRICEIIEFLGYSVAPYGSAAEFDRRARWAPLYLVADESRRLQSMTILLSRFDHLPYVIAYRGEPATHDIVEAMKIGADDYLAWPFSASAIRSRLATARTRAASGTHKGEPHHPPLAARRPERTLLKRIVRRMRASRSSDCS